MNPLTTKEARIQVLVWLLESTEEGDRWVPRPTLAAEFRGRGWTGKELRNTLLSLVKLELIKKRSETGGPVSLTATEVTFTARGAAVGAAQQCFDDRHKEDP